MEVKNNATPEFLNLVLFKLKRVKETSSQEKLFLGSPKEDGRGWGEERRLKTQPHPPKIPTI